MILISKTSALGQTKLYPNKNLASRERLELPPRVLETRMLPLHQRDTIMVDRNGIEPFLQACKARVPPTTPTAHNFQRTLVNACIETH